ncbi:MAG TPA: hypothetical protein VNF93_02495 [Buchnera sp. (in: enterobacteria)]|nr:hypothetical protein [Buchnera sp. (in: enterobacteria)]
MSIKEFQINFTGQLVNPRIGHLLTDDTLSTVTTAGYLNPYIKSQGFSVLPTDFIFVAASDGMQIYKPVFSGEEVTLTVLP